MKSAGTKLGSIAWNQRQERLHLSPVLPSKVLPQTQAGIALWSEPRLCPIPKGAWNAMSPDELDVEMASAGGAEAVGRAGDGQDERQAVHARISAGARAVKRLLWSVWLLLLLPLVWTGSDWMSLLILSQVFLVAAKLVQPAVTKANADASSASGVLCMQEGEDCARG